MTITERIADELVRIFGTDTVIYTENQTDGFSEPSFYVCKAGSTVIMPRAYGNQRRTYGYQIVYFDKSNAALEKTEELLLANFKKLPDFAHIRNREFMLNAIEKTLIFTFDITVDMHLVTDEQTFERIDANAETTKESGR